jgi:hypothetical protein
LFQVFGAIHRPGVAAFRRRQGVHIAILAQDAAEMLLFLGRVNFCLAFMALHLENPLFKPLSGHFSLDYEGNPLKKNPPFGGVPFFFGDFPDRNLPAIAKRQLFRNM